MAFFGLPPASAKIRKISNGDSGSLPGWKLTGAPVDSFAAAAARMDFLSNGSKGQLHPISPINPHLTSGQSNAPMVSSSIICWAILSTVIVDANSTF